MQIRFKKLDSMAQIPSRATDGSAGFDITTTNQRTLKPGESFLFQTGLASAIEEGYCVVLFDRSGMGGKKNIHRLAGVIDSDYRGEWLVSLINLSNEERTISIGDKIIQGLVLPVPELLIVEVSSLDDTVRGSGGFGSTDAST
jgi:dUTP pyrophosphatase